jgi:hypothetical protein
MPPRLTAFLVIESRRKNSNAALFQPLGSTEKMPPG